MKNRLYTFVFCLAALALCAVSCNREDNDLVFVSTATFKRTGTGLCYFKESDSTAFVPSNLPVDFLKGISEKRSIIWFSSDRKPLTQGIEGFKYSYIIDVQAVDTVYTKNPVASLGSEKEDAGLYGDDYVGIYLSESGAYPYTAIEDGYLCVRFVYNLVPYSGITHIFNLVTGVNPQDPYEVELRHNGCGETYGESQDGFMAFPLKSLPSTDGQVRKLTLVWKSGVTMKKERFEFDYCSRTDWPED